MKLTRPGRLAGVLLVGTLALAACGSDDNTAGSDGATETGSTAACDAAGTLNAEGSSAQKNAIDEVISSFQEVCPDATVNYNPTGSGAGIKQFIAGQVDFAGSDSALKTAEVDGVVEADAAAQRCANPAWNLPLVAGPIAIAYNLPGVDGLTVNPEVAAKMYLGQISTWNDPAIAALNEGITLPATPIKVFYRSDESGTTENFAKYLNATAPAVWTVEPGKAWPGTVGEGREKSSGVAEGVAATEGGLGYMEWSYATDSQLGVAKVDNGAGAVELSGESAGKAVAVAQAAGEGNDLRLKLDYTTSEAGTYPIVLVTYEIACSKGSAKAAAIKGFLTYTASTGGQQSLAELGYAPLPETVRAKVETAVAAIA